MKKLMLLDNSLDVHTRLGTAIRDLEAHLLGQLIRPAHDDYDSARQVWNRSIDQHPALIVRAANAADVVQAVAFAREHGLPLAVRSGGHSFAGYGTVDAGLVVDLSRLKDMRINPQRRVAWAQPGLTWGEYAEQAQPYGLATSSGDMASVGLGGLTLGGGIGWQVRKHGLTIDNLLSVELVTADGRLIRASSDEHPDLFWGLCGGGGNFGVATAFTFKLQPAGLVLGGGVVYPATADILRGYADYAIQAPDELTTIAFLLPAPPLPFIPPALYGTLITIIAVCYSGDLDEGNRVVEPLRRLGTPIADVTAPMPYPALFELTAQGTVPRLGTARSGFLSEMSHDTIEMILDQCSRIPMATTMVELRALGGAMARVPEDTTAFGHRRQPYFVAFDSSWDDPTQADAAQGWASDFWAALRPRTSGVYVNFLADEGQARVREAYPPATYVRLAELKRRYDPDNVFRHNQNIRPAS